MSDEQGNSSPLLAVLFIGQLITLLAVAGVGWMVQNEFAAVKAEIQRTGSAAAADQPARPSRPAEPQEYGDWATIIRPFNVSMGPEDAPVTIIEFSDFQCPFCSRFYEQSLGQILEQYGDQVRFVYKNLPLTQIHPAAMSAGMALQCANRESSELAWKLHDTMFENYRSLSDSSIKEMATEVGLGDSFMQCLDNAETQSEVEQDSQDAVAAGARGTPAFLVNGKFMSGAQPFSRFKAEIESALSN